MAYCGPAAAATSHFASLGFVTPPHENPAEYLITVLDESQASIVDAWRQGEARAMPTPSATAVEEGIDAPIVGGSYAATACTQAWVLLERQVWCNVCVTSA